jgi:hypothetical protein
MNDDIEVEDYNTLPEYLKRVIDELSYVYEKYDALSNFLDTERFNSLSTVQRDLLLQQEAAMYLYLSILNLRIEVEQEIIKSSKESNNAKQTN